MRFPSALANERKKLTDMIIANLETEKCIFDSGVSEGLVVPQNPLSNQKYKGGNFLKLLMLSTQRRYKDPRWITFLQAKKEGWKVKSGSKSVRAEYWGTVEDKENQNSDSKNKKTKVFSNIFYLFNGKDIDGIPEIPSLRNNLSPNLIIELLKESSGCEIKEVANPTPCYIPSLDEIQLPLRENFKTDIHYINVLLHEMAHSTCHPDRLDRKEVIQKPDVPYDRESYAKEELVAEISSVFMRAELGIKMTPEDSKRQIENSSVYIESWINNLKNDHNEIYRAAAKAQKIADFIIGNYKKEELKLNTKENVFLSKEKEEIDPPKKQKPKFKL